MRLLSIIWWLKKLGFLFQKTYPGELFALTLTIIFAGIRPEGNRRSAFSNFLSQIFFTGIEAIPYITLLALVIGAITILQAVTIMPKLGGGDALGDVMVAVVIRELGPLITALFIAGRTGSAFSTFLGNMKVLHEIDALKSMGINPIQYQIVPAFFGTLVAMVGLTMIFSLVAVLGGYFIVLTIKAMAPGILTAHLSLGLFMDKIFESLSLMDVVLITVKPILFGVFISVIACYHGMSISIDIREVPKATRMTVVRSFVIIIICDMLLAIPFLLQAKEKLIL
jgi:phospholipid/cholesterol/gamma-HCH transport system permease protein